MSVQNWHEEFNEFRAKHSKISKICTLMGYYIISELREYRQVIIDCTTFWNLTCAFKNDMKYLTNFHRLKNSDFILASKMAESNQNENSKQPDWPDAVWKHYLTLEINK